MTDSPADALREALAADLLSIADLLAIDTIKHHMSIGALDGLCHLLRSRLRDAALALSAVRGEALPDAAGGNPHTDDHFASPPAPAVEWVKQQYGATVATILETPDGCLEIQKLNSGKFNVIVHQRRESDSFDDCSIQVKAEHLAAIGALVSEPPVGVTEEQIAAGAQLVDPSGIFNLTWQECLERSQAVLEAALAPSAPVGVTEEMIEKAFSDPVEFRPTGWRETYPGLRMPTAGEAKARLIAALAQSARTK